MHENHYKYKGPLDPVKDRLVCVTRTEDLKRVIEGINRGDYWSILGSRQIGKTTFLRQIQNEFTDAHYIYFDFEISQTRDIGFYQWLRNQVLEKVPHNTLPVDNWDDESPEFSFIEFLAEFKPEDLKKKIVFLFDEIDGLPHLRTFLHIWRKIFNDRYYKNELSKYAVVITGSVDLITLTIGSNSPFNIAEILYLKDFSDEDSRTLIDIPFRELDIRIEPKAKDKLISQIAGYPQMLQQACHILVNNAVVPNGLITERDVDDTVEDLLTTSSILGTLKQGIEMNDILENLLGDILKGKKVKYFPNKEFSILGAGPIVEENSYCKIRNAVYKKCIDGILKNVKIKRKQIKKRLKGLLIIIELLIWALSITIGFLSLKKSWHPGIIVVFILVVAAILVLFGILRIKDENTKI